ncbi:threonine synthase, partial [bacterium]|nr:threonine synthase [bacterium]
DFGALAGSGYPEIAYAVLRRFTAGVIDDATLKSLCEDAYDYDVPLEHVTGRRHLMRLDRGPTASFKDFAARMMARWMGVLMQAEDGDLVILTATSGDTGSAVAHAYYGVERVSVVVLFPVKEVSDRQRKQMTTLGGNVRIIGIDGKFDDCQALVKQAFADPDLSAIRFSSANSINIGRILPQSVYYFYAWAKLQSDGEDAVFSVPSGNFGDMCGGLLAWRAGLPAEKFIIATNENDEFPLFMATGSYKPISPSKKCISNAMNVGHPSNLARLFWYYGGKMDELGVVHKMPDLEAMKRDLFAVSISDDETRKTISEAYNRYDTLLEPHGAVGWAGLMRYIDEVEDWKPCISLETADPAKFPEEIVKAVGLEPPVPPSISRLEEKEEQFYLIDGGYDRLKESLHELFG